MLIMGVVDASQRFIFFSADNPGRRHDSVAFLESQLGREFESGMQRGVLIGDGGSVLRQIC